MCVCVYVCVRNNGGILMWFLLAVSLLNHSKMKFNV